MPALVLCTSFRELLEGRKLDLGPLSGLSDGPLQAAIPDSRHGDTIKGEAIRPALSAVRAISYAHWFPPVPARKRRRCSARPVQGESYPDAFGVAVDRYQRMVQER
jgi:hypothetical protein